jgi:CRP-like cAMP-binding protein
LPNLKHAAPLQNRLLAALPATERRRLLGVQPPVELVVSDVLVEPGERGRYVFFPIRGFVSLLNDDAAHEQLEVGLVGNEGIVGASLSLGAGFSPLRALVQGEGSAWRLDAGTFVRGLRSSPVLCRVLNLYLHVQLTQFAQAAVCTRFHLVEARLARRLLVTRDRAQSSEFRVTQEFLARVLGVRRVGVTRAATALRQRNLIRYTRGSVEICDGAGLEAAACGCYAADRATYARVLG